MVELKPRTHRQNAEQPEQTVQTLLPLREPVVKEESVVEPLTRRQPKPHVQPEQLRTLLAKLDVIC